MDARDAKRRSTPGQTQTAGSTKLQRVTMPPQAARGPPFPPEEQSAPDRC